MTENEAIESIKYLKEQLENDSPDMFAYTRSDIISIDVAIKALEEIKQYRAIGTVEECQEAREMQLPRKVKYVFGETLCPECSCSIRRCFDFCKECGQKLDWSE